ncbi:hypothetical protein HZQ75_04310 [Elizabethkingia anophelis]|uniref:Uncharacterized protein n=1 Tax=Elizabethkingia anophelis R26 TaxID=1246994 RepID=A0ABM6MYV9_9FLAO|nr:hypothetical protein [Elizabethkingia anophelis]ATC38079.1 hypothetical protein BAZ09_018300 [Elizabethkingia anophelis R26]ATC41758.1 hypothetical protein EAAG1_018515 [Elizabethkingia anophelis Ag1]ATC45435.1 hypothetical protein CMV41_18515 [Elizabethkingia anophelis]ATC49111.1 hypothetical protein CMV40_18515 [Elizabethkingia anophelis]ELR78167.1 hypothetical protein D505_15928 [Elizabethkingia anophelis R26]
MEKKFMNEQKKEYTSPEVTCILIDMEQGIAAASAIVRPVKPDEDIQSSWEDEDQTGGVKWD